MRAIFVTTSLELVIGVLDSAAGPELKTMTDLPRIYSQHFFRKLYGPTDSVSDC